MYPRLMSALAAFGLVLILAGCADSDHDLPDFTRLVEDSAPAVVNISTTLKPLDSERRDEALADGSPLGELFRQFFGAPEGEEGMEESGLLGSGFILDREGYILTNWHVIEDADQIIVRLSDRRELIAKVVGKDVVSDLALLKIEASDLPTLPLGDSDRLKVGEWVLAIGSPFGFEHSVTAGIVSAKGRGIPNEDNQTYVPFIQTDVAINLGNSGGPLLNMRGEVVGINSQIYTESGGYMGLSFAIPVNLARNIAEQLKKTGHVARGFLGVQVQDVDRELAEVFGLDRPVGALVVRVMPGSPAEMADLRPGDVIVEVDGTPLAESSALPMVVGRIAPGKQARLTVVRERAFVHIKVRVAAAPDSASVPAHLIEPPATQPARGNRAPMRLQAG